ncbi:UNVERIFIED_CONTAM: PTS transporter subunit EIIB [Campylobacter lari]
MRAKNGDIKKLDKSMKLDELILFLGGKENIKDVESSLSRIKIHFNDKGLIKIDELSNLKYISGVLISSTNISLNVGEYAQKLTDELKTYLTFL